MVARALAMVHTAIFDAWAAYDADAVARASAARCAGRPRSARTTTSARRSPTRPTARSWTSTPAPPRWRSSTPSCASSATTPRTRAPTPPRPAASGTRSRRRCSTFVTATGRTSSAATRTPRGTSRQRLHDHQRPEQVAAAASRRRKRGPALHRAPLGRGRPVRPHLGRPVPAERRARHGGRSPLPQAGRGGAGVLREAQRRAEGDRRVLGRRAVLRAPARSLVPLRPVRLPARLPHAGQGREDVLRDDECDPRRERRVLGRQARLRLGPPRHGDPLPPRRRGRQGVGRALPGDAQDQGRGLASLPGSQRRDAALPRVPVGPQHVQRRGGRDPQALHGLGRVRSLRDPTCRDVAGGAGRRAQEGRDPDVEDGQRRRRRGGHLARRYGGIHFVQGDLDGRAMGRKIGAQAWEEAQRFVDGTA